MFVTYFLLLKRMAKEVGENAVSNMQTRLRRNFTAPLFQDDTSKTVAEQHFMP